MNNNVMITPTGALANVAHYKLEEEAINPNNQRQQRALPFINIPMDVLNAMSAKVLSSIEALAILQEDEGACLRRVLCENNKYSRSLSGLQRIWLPLWR